MLCYIRTCVEKVEKQSTNTSVLEQETIDNKGDSDPSEGHNTAFRSGDREQYSAARDITWKRHQVCWGWIWGKNWGTLHQQGSNRDDMVLSFCSFYVCCVCFLGFCGVFSPSSSVLFSSCVLLSSLSVPPHLSCIFLMSPALIPEYFQVCSPSKAVLYLLH